AARQDHRSDRVRTQVLHHELAVRRVVRELDPGRLRLPPAWQLPRIPTVLTTPWTLDGGAVRATGRNLRASTAVGATRSPDLALCCGWMWASVWSAPVTPG